jgi:hypothetical protein
VRLKPTPDDIYSWDRLDCREHLFTKNISNHSIRSLREIYREVGQSFEAVENKQPCTLQTKSVTSTYCLKETSSFRSTINELQNHITILQSELEQWQAKATLEAEVRQQMEKKAAYSERMMRTVLEDNQRLEQHIEDWKQIAEQCEERRMELGQALGKILVCLKEVGHTLDD